MLIQADAHFTISIHS